MRFFKQAVLLVAVVLAIAFIVKTVSGEYNKTRPSPYKPRINADGCNLDAPDAWYKCAPLAKPNR